MTDLQNVEGGAEHIDTVPPTVEPLECGQKPAQRVSRLDIKRLASLSVLDYEGCRKAEADKFLVRTSVLDAEVEKARASTSSSTQDGQGSAFELTDLTPWPDRVDGAVLLDEIAETFRQFAVLPDHAHEVLALWCVMTHAIDLITVAPLIAITSPVKGCGKSTVLDILSRLVRRPLPASNVSPAALFRSIDKWAPTMIIDEADSFLRDNNDVRNIINSGHTRATAFVLRCTGEESEPRRFNTWGAKAIAKIGKVPETIADRSIIIQLRRALPDERVKKIRRAGSQHFVRLARMAARWVADNTRALRRADPALPERLSNRAADNAEPLLAIADVVGSGWGERARRAVLHMSGLGDDGGSVGVRLLRDVLAVFVRRDTNRLWTKEIIPELAADELAPWSTFDNGRPITSYQLGRKLGEFGISSEDLRRDVEVFKGYKRREIEDQARRYLPKTTPEEPLHPRPPLHEAQSQGVPIRNIAECSSTFAAPTTNENGDVAEVADIAAILCRPVDGTLDVDQVARTAIGYRRVLGRHRTIFNGRPSEGCLAPTDTLRGPKPRMAGHTSSPASPLVSRDNHDD